MNLYLLTFALALAPSLFWLVIYRWEDREDPKPKKAILTVFIAGAALAFIVVAVEGALLVILPNFTGWHWLKNIMVATVFIAAIEEALKLLFSRLIIWHEKVIEQIIDGPIFSIALSLGLAAVENFVYFAIFLIPNWGLASANQLFALPSALTNWSTSAIFLLIFAMRFLFTTLMHTVTSGIMGLHLGRAFFQQERWRQILDQGLFFAIVIHASFNLLAIYGQIWLALIIVILAAIWLFSHLRSKQNLQIRRRLSYLK
ncbi:MAG: PrsW family glutamic-type intramembrane protease [Candidatus Buchananbacteria bacterium]